MRPSSFRLAAVGLLASAMGAGVAYAEPWAVRRIATGLAAVGATKVEPGAPADTWNVLAIGVFCGTSRINPGRINLYFYGIGADRLATGVPIGATLDIDGVKTQLRLQPIEDIAVSPVEPDIAQTLMDSRATAVQVHDYNSRRRDVVDMDGASSAIRSALKTCLPQP